MRGGRRVKRGRFVKITMANCNPLHCCLALVKRDLKSRLGGL